MADLQYQRDLNSIPIIATAPLLALWLGTGPQVQIAIARSPASFRCWSGTVQGLQADGRAAARTDACALRLASPDAALPADTKRVPYLFAGLKIAAPSAVLGPSPRNGPAPIGASAP